MKRIVCALTLVALTYGLSSGQEEPGPNFEHLKGFGPYIGTWKYEGPLLEELPDFGEKGTECEIQFTWRRILNKNAVEQTWNFGVKGGVPVTGKALIGWDSKEQRITQGGMNSLGSMGLGTIVLDKVAKTLTLTSQGINGQGEESTVKSVVTKTGKDSLTWKALERTGRLADGESPEYVLKRVPRKKPAAK